MFECVNESDEKGESENVARVGGDGDVHFLNLETERKCSASSFSMSFFTSLTSFPSRIIVEIDGRRCNFLGA